MANIEDITYVFDNPTMQILSTDRSTDSGVSGVRPLHPFPDGWYVLELSSALENQQLIEKTWMGREIVVWRDREGAVCVADAFCPHLGSHLGPSVGGMVLDGNLVCPFHGFQYDVTGKCVAARDAPPPRSARLKLYEVAEVNGFIFAYWDNAGRLPEWQLPDVCPDGWEGRVAKRLRLKAHPQTTTENSVDLCHLAHVHGYRDLKQLSPTEIDGPFLSSSYEFRKGILTRGLQRLEMWTAIDVGVWGLGISTVEVHGREPSLEVRLWIMATPVDGDHIDYWLAVDPKGASNWLRILPQFIRHKIIPKVLLNDLVLEVGRDAEIWSRQRYQPRPVLSRADGDLFRFRRYCEQFYGEANAG